MKKTDAEVRRDNEVNDLKTIMDTAAGRRFVWRLLSEAKIFQPCFTGNATTYYNEGRRELGLLFFADVTTHCRDNFIKAQTENIEMEKRNG
jgi:hypothetical protein